MWPGLEQKIQIVFLFVPRWLDTTGPQSTFFCLQRSLISAMESWSPAKIVPKSKLSLKTTFPVVKLPPRLLPSLDDLLHSNFFCRVTKRPQCEFLSTPKIPRMFLDSMDKFFLTMPALDHCKDVPTVASEAYSDLSHGTCEECHNSTTLYLLPLLEIIFVILLPVSGENYPGEIPEEKPSLTLPQMALL